MTLLHLLWHHGQNTQRVWVTCQNLIVTLCVLFTEQFSFQTLFVKKISYLYWLWFGVLCRCILALLLTPFLPQACVLMEMLPQGLQTNRRRRARWQMRRSWTNCVNIINISIHTTIQQFNVFCPLISRFSNIPYCDLQEPLSASEIPRKSTRDMKKLVRGEFRHNRCLKNTSQITSHQSSNRLYITVSNFFFSQGIRNGIHSHWCCHRTGGKGWLNIGWKNVHIVCMSQYKQFYYFWCKPKERSTMTWAGFHSRVKEWNLLTLVMVQLNQSYFK